MTKVFLSPSDQDNNPVAGGGNEQMYAQMRCARAAEVLRAHGITVKVSEAGIGDDTNGYAASVAEGEAWGPDLYVADHTNATGNPAVKRSGVQAYCYPEPNSQRLGRCINARMDPIVPGGASIQDGSHLYEVNGPSCTAVLMESGYHDNPEDAEVIRTETRAMGEAIANGILDYLGITINTNNNQEEDDMALTDSDVDRIAARTAQAIMGGGGAISPMYQDRYDGHYEYAETQLFSLRQRLVAGWLKPILEALTKIAAQMEILSQERGLDPEEAKRIFQEQVAKAFDDIKIVLTTDSDTSN